MRDIDTARPERERERERERPEGEGVELSRSGFEGRRRGQEARGRGCQGEKREKPNFLGMAHHTGIPRLGAWPCLLFLVRLADAKWGAELWHGQPMLPGMIVPPIPALKKIQAFSYSAHRSRPGPGQRSNMKIAWTEDRTDEP